MMENTDDGSHTKSTGMYSLKMYVIHSPSSYVFYKEAGKVKAN